MQSDGLVERFNKTLLEMLSMTVLERERDWDLFLPSLLFAYRTSAHETTATTPFQPMFGRDPRLPEDLLYNIPTPEYQSVDEYSTALIERLQQSYQWVQKYASRKQQRQKVVYDLKCRGTSCKVNDLVFLHSPAVPRNKCKKFHRPWRGPFKVTKVVSPCVYRIVDCSNSRKKYVVHFNRLKPAPSKLVSERRQLPEPFEEDSRDNTAENHEGDEEEDYTVDESTERGERVRQGPVAEPERNVEQIRDGDHLSVLGDSDGEERQADGAESNEEAQQVLRRSARNRRPPDRYGNPWSLPDDI